MKSTKSMFDIFTTHDDGSLYLIESLSCVKKAEEMAERLSCLFPDQYFVYFERMEPVSSPAAKFEGLRASSPVLGVSSMGFLA